MKRKGRSLVAKTHKNTYTSNTTFNTLSVLKHTWERGYGELFFPNQLSSYIQCRWSIIAITVRRTIHPVLVSMQCAASAEHTQVFLNATRPYL